MAVRDVAYIEMYAIDKDAVVEYFVSSMGFTRVAKSASLHSNSTLLQQRDVRFIVTGGPTAVDFLDVHGDGIADIAFACDDANATCDSVAAAGGTVFDPTRNRPVVAGFGGVRHTLITGMTRSRAWLPPDRRWIPVAPAAAQRAGRIARLDHIAICLEAGSLSDFTDFYCIGFGFDRYSREYIEVADQAMDSTVVRSRSGGATLTLLEPDTSKSPGQIDSFLDRNRGAGVQHLAFLTNAIIPAVREFKHRGVDFLETPGVYYDALAERFPDIRDEIERLRSTNVLADRDEWGYLLQLFTRSPHERNTLFYELIERRGAHGFGSANIRALYEAVERDGLVADERVA